MRGPWFKLLLTMGAATVSWQVAQAFTLKCSLVLQCMFSSIATREANKNRVQNLIQNKFKLDYLCKDWCNLRMQYLYALPKPLVGRLHKALSAQSLQWLHYVCTRKECLNLKFECPYFKMSIGSDNILFEMKYIYIVNINC